MTEQRETGGGYLKESATDFLKRSSSVEILTPTNGQLLARRPNISTSHLPEPVTKSETKTEPTPPDRQTSASTGTLALSSKNNTPMQNGTVSPRNQRSLENVRLGEKVPRSLKRKGAQLPPLRMPQTNAAAPTPPNATPQGTPIIGERGHIFTISSAVPDDPIAKNPPRRESGPDPNPLVKRRPSTKTPVTSPKEGEAAGGGIPHFMFIAGSRAGGGGGGVCRKRICEQIDEQGVDVARIFSIVFKEFFFYMFGCKATQRKSDI